MNTLKAPPSTVLTASQHRKLDVIADQDPQAKVVAWHEERKGPVIQTSDRRFVLMPRGTTKSI